MVVEEELIRTWPRWTIHRIRASESLVVEEPYVMENGKWMFNPKNQVIHDESHITKCQSLFHVESHITKCQSLLNQDMK
jgi:hypothetical protein